MARIVFMGTPSFAVATLQALAAAHTIVGVVTQPDRPSGRGRRLELPPVKAFALSAGLPIIQPQRLREPAALAQLQAWAPDLIVVAAFGQILRPAVLDLPAHGCLNVHGSLLPRHRGAAPIAAALLAGEGETGITIMRMDPGLDTGPMLGQRALPILPDDTTGSLTDRLAPLGAALLLEVIPAYLAGQLPPVPQDDAQATYAPQLKKDDARLDFTRPALELERRVRAYNPWPGAFAPWPDPAAAQPRLLKIMRAAVLSERLGESGEVVATPQGPAVGADASALLLLEVQPPGKRPMSAADFARGARGFIGSRLI
jgi:methionyl-tRNA formyltransferase